jgi:molecular chaperone DnaK
MGTGREQKITITASSGLSKDEIDRMMRDAESHAGEDQRKREEIEARNRLDSLTYQVEKTFGENRDKLDATAASDVEAALADAKKATEEGGVERMNDAFNRLQTASHKIAEALYQQQGSTPADTEGGEQASAAGAAGGQSSQGSAGGGDDNVIDAEYVDVDENK